MKTLYMQAAEIPIKEDPVANEVALGLVRKDKLREVKAGYDGTWAAHPGLIPVCMEIFNNNMGNAPNQNKDNETRRWRKHNRARPLADTKRSLHHGRVWIAMTMLE
ncbi:hypothetical protein GLYMA_19G088650v4 [Glycine max]|nr:hypothetical protein GLYMA_19G088650v4 [Glycine max]KAH1076992.1 hypothetical protein GYH30_052475 [Glycine max]